MTMTMTISHCSRQIDDNDEDDNLLVPFQGIETYDKMPPMQMPR